MAIQRMTAQSKVNIKAAKEAVLISNENGYMVELVGNTGAKAFIENASGPINYTSMAAAKKAVVSHNSTLTPELKPTI